MRFWEYWCYDGERLVGHGWCADMQVIKDMEEIYERVEHKPISQAMYLLHTNQLKAKAIYGGESL